MTCRRTQEFLAKKHTTIASTVDAKKHTMNRNAALALLDDIYELFAAKGKKVVHLDLRTNPPKDEILAVLLGPTGNLRAPTVRKGRTLLVGFDEATYARFVK